MLHKSNPSLYSKSSHIHLHWSSQTCGMLVILQMWLTVRWFSSRMLCSLPQHSYAQPSGSWNKRSKGFEMLKNHKMTSWLNQSRILNISYGMSIFYLFLLNMSILKRKCCISFKNWLLRAFSLCKIFIY